MAAENPHADEVRAALAKHGYGFQHAVIREIRGLRGGNQWRDDGTEFPVELNGISTQVDLLLRSPQGLLVCECKRVDPALGLWCFARSVLSTTFDSQIQSIVREVISYDESQGRAFVVRDANMPSETPQYHVGLELKTGEKGERYGTNRGALEDAVTQALRGVNGITNAIAADHRRLMAGATHLTLLPVVITTAKLVTCDTDLADSDVRSGRLPDAIKTTERPWIWFRRASTPALRHSVQTRFRDGRNLPGFNEVSNAVYVRSIAIVSTATEDALRLFLRAAAYQVGDF